MRGPTAEGRIGRGALVVAAALVALGTSGAQAAVPTEVSVRSVKTDVADNAATHDGIFQFATGTAGCLGDRKAIAPGLGWNAGRRKDSPFISAFYARSLFGNVFTGPEARPAWYVQGASDETEDAIGHDLKMTSSTICAHVPGFSFVNDSMTSFPASQTDHNGNPTRRVTDVICPPGKVALGAGGGFFDDDFAPFDALTVGEIEPILSLGSGDPVGAEVTLNSDNDGPVIDASHDAGQAWVSCAKDSLKVDLRVKDSKPFVSQLEHNNFPLRRTVKIKCKPDEVAMGAGLTWNQASDSVAAQYVGALAPVVRKRKPIGYMVTGASDEDPAVVGEITFQAAVTCVKT